MTASSERCFLIGSLANTLWLVFKCAESDTQESKTGFFLANCAPSTTHQVLVRNLE
jgi:hypothetical protein